MRILITGASGSGTTTLGRTLAESLNLPFFDVDDYYWAPTNPPFQQKRSAQERRSLLVEDLTMTQDGAVLSGSVVDWGAEIEDSFALIVFLIVAAEIRIPRLINRETERLGAPQKERLDLIAELWDSLATEPESIPLTDAQADELDRRLAEMDQDDSLGIPWETVLARIRERK